MLPGLVVLLKTSPGGVHGCFPSFEYFPVLAHRADLDTDTAGGPVFFSQSSAAGGTAYLIHRWWEICLFLHLEGIYWAVPGAREAVGAQVITGNGISFQFQGGEYTGETDPGPPIGS